MKKFFKNTANKNMIFVVGMNGNKTRKERFLNGVLCIEDEAVLKCLEKTLDFRNGFILECDEKGITEKDREIEKAETKKIDTAVEKATKAKDLEIEALKKQLSEKNVSKETKKDESK